MNAVAKAYIYLYVAILFAMGAITMIAPGSMVEALHLSPLSPAGVGELRGLYGGGFFAMGLVLLGGLHYRPVAPGLLIAMAIIFAGIVFGRLVSLVVDRELVATPIAGASELLLALACWHIYQQVKTDQAR